MTRTVLGSHPPTVTFCGAARTVTGSMHLVQIGPYKLLLDCGLYFGREGDDRLRAGHLSFKPADIDAVILSHAHIDHCGNLPELVHLGFSGPIYCTPATRDLLPVMLADSARIQLEEEVSDGTGSHHVATFTDVQRTLQQCVPVPYDTPTVINDAVELLLVEAGHVLGSAVVALRMQWNSREYRLTYTGDLGRPGFPFLRPPAPLPPADLLISECTYGGKRHQPPGVMARVMAEAITHSLDEGGKVLIPAFSLGRAQVVAHYLQHWMADGLVPRLPLYVDSPMVAAIVDVYRRHPESLAPGSVREFLEPTPVNGAPPIYYLSDWEESKQLTQVRGSCIIIASGGMLDGGRALYHLQNYIDDPRASIVLVSYQSPASLGRRLLEKGPIVQFLGRRWNKWAGIVDVNGFSGHADHEDLMRAFQPLSGQTRIELVHGDVPQAEALALALVEQGFAYVDIPTPGRTVPVAIEH